MDRLITHASTGMSRSRMKGWGFFNLAVSKLLAVFIKEIPLKGLYLYKEKNTQSKEDHMQLNFPINT
ncbi:MAG: hypothetical protein V1715_06265 [bacterium]